jgi:hypothetical protein
MAGSPRSSLGCGGRETSPSQSHSDCRRIPDEPSFVQQTVEGGRETCDLQLREEERFYGDRFRQDMGFNDISADALAQMRARRILLNEPLPDREGRPRGAASDINDAAFEMFVRGFGVPLEVPHSPLPALYEDLQGDAELFLAAARLVGVLWLRLSAVVAEVHVLDLALHDQTSSTSASRGGAHAGIRMSSRSRLRSKASASSREWRHQASGHSRARCSGIRGCCSGRTARVLLRPSRSSAGCRPGRSRNVSSRTVFGDASS